MEVVESNNSAWFCESCSLQFDGIKVFDLHQRLKHEIEEKEIQIKEEPLEGKTFSNIITPFHHERFKG